MEQKINLSDWSDEKLKAVVYDQMKAIKRAEINIQALEQEIVKREQAPNKKVQAVKKAEVPQEVK